MDELQPLGPDRSLFDQQTERSAGATPKNRSAHRIVTGKVRCIQITRHSVFHGVVMFAIQHEV